MGIGNASWKIKKSETEMVTLMWEEDRGGFSNDLTRFNKIAIQGRPQMAVEKEAICLSRVY